MIMIYLQLISLNSNASPDTKKKPSMNTLRESTFFERKDFPLLKSKTDVKTLTSDSHFKIPTVSHGAQFALIIIVVIMYWRAPTGKTVDCCDRFINTLLYSQVRHGKWEGGNNKKNVTVQFVCTQILSNS